MKAGKHLLTDTLFIVMKALQSMLSVSNMTLTLKMPRNLHLKILSVYVVC